MQITYLTFDLIYQVLLTPKDLLLIQKTKFVLIN